MTRGFARVAAHAVGEYSHAELATKEGIETTFLEDVA